MRTQSIDSLARVVVTTAICVFVCHGVARSDTAKEFDAKSAEDRVKFIQDCADKIADAISSQAPDAARRIRKYFISESSRGNVEGVDGA